MPTRKNHIHQKTAELIKQHQLIVTEELSIGNMTASAKGSVEKVGKNVKQKAGLNGTILDTAPGSFLNVLCTKAEEAGYQVIVLNPRKALAVPNVALLRCRSQEEPGRAYASV